MKVVITGGFGFLGWHTACRLRALHEAEIVRVGRREFENPAMLASSLDGANAVLHLAGINRADLEAEVENGNVWLADRLADAVRSQGRPIPIVYSNSVHADTDTAYGRGKATAAQILVDVAEATDSPFSNIMLPNIFGEHGRPNYNSFIATMASEIAHGRKPKISQDRSLTLLHAQDAASELIAGIGSTGVAEATGTEVQISAVREQLLAMHSLYGERGEIPSLTEPFAVDLFNTYRSYLDPARATVKPKVHSDPRGLLFETVRAHGGTGQAYFSSTLPGQSRGEHYHLRKFERFLVVRGEAEIGLRKLYSDEVMKVRVSGEEPTIVDMPTLWVHNIRNIGDTELLTVFWSDQLLDPDNPDQFPEKVETSAL